MLSKTIEVCSGFRDPPAESSADTPSSLYSKPLDSIVGEPVVFRISLYSPGDALPHHKISYSLPPPPPPASKSVTHQFQTVTFHSQTIPGAAGSVTHGDVGNGEEGGKSQIAE